MPASRLDRSRLLKPARTSLAACEDVAARNEDPASLWEALSSNGITPPDWVDAPGRLFGDWCVACRGFGFVYEGENRGTPCPRCGGACFDAGAIPSPPLALRLAADVAGVLAAEALAAELVARLSSLGATVSVERVRWRLAAPPFDVATRQWSLLRSKHGLLPFAGYARESFDAALEADAREAGRFESRWPDAPSPFDPLFGLYDRGYALDTVMRSGPVLVVALDHALASSPEAPAMHHPASTSRRV